MKIMSTENCNYYEEKLSGREGKLFCNPSCKAMYHYVKNKGEEPNMFNRIDQQLKTNRRLLKLYNKAGKAMIRKETLHQEGFDPKYFTHYWKNDKGKLYLFCYEFGFISTKDNGKDKYLLIQWQDYMN